VLLAEFTDPGAADLLVFGSIGFLIGEVAAEAAARVVRARVYAGYSGWGPGQLEAEMAEKAWIVEPARPEDVFTETPELLWSAVLSRKGEPYRRIARIPFDPSMN
jgi:putative transcriptional regulator